MNERRRPRPQGGFTLIEILVVVAIIAILGSIAVPALGNAMLKGRKNAAINDLRVLREAFMSYARDEGHFPLWNDFDQKTFEPLIARGYFKTPTTIFKHSQHHRLDYYTAYNWYDDPNSIDDYWTAPSGFTLRITFKYDPSVRYYVTEQRLYKYENGRYVTVGVNTAR